MSLSKSISDLIYVDAKNGDTEPLQIVSLEKCKTSPEFLEKRVRYYATSIPISREEPDDNSNVPVANKYSDVKVLYLYREKGIGTESEMFLDNHSVALQTRRACHLSLRSVIRTLMCCIGGNREN